MSCHDFVRTWLELCDEYLVGIHKYSSKFNVMANICTLELSSVKILLDLNIQTSTDICHIHALNKKKVNAYPLNANKSDNVRIHFKRIVLVRRRKRERERERSRPRAFEHVCTKHNIHQSQFCCKSERLFNVFLVQLWYAALVDAIWWWWFHRLPFSFRARVSARGSRSFC